VIKLYRGERLKVKTPRDKTTKSTGPLSIIGNRSKVEPSVVLAV
jgi:hypothetical protein